jgi:hypothetical protein
MVTNGRSEQMYWRTNMDPTTIVALWFCLSIGMLTWLVARHS